MAQSGDRVVEASRRGALPELARPFNAVRFRDPSQFPIGENGPTFEQRDKDLIPVMPSARLDHYVAGLVLLMDLERFRERHFRRGLTYSGNLLLAMLSQKFRKPRFRYREMRSAQALPNFFVVAECPGIIAAGLMAHQVLLAGLFPRLNGLRFLGGFHCLVSLCTATVENNREQSKQEI